ncbi:nucleolar protein 11-like isoform X2 [Acanthaster planci]|nr:nucleolar protein 11-like isoform X2 [Acanthaster planci]
MSSSTDQPGSLASLLGTESSAALSTQSRIPVTLDWTEKPKTKDGSTTPHKDEVESIVEEMLDPTKVKTLLHFSRVCKAFLEKSQTDLDLPSRTLLASLILNNITDRNKDETKKHFWPKKSLLRIIEECNVAASSCPSFLLSAIEMRDLEVVKSCVEHMQDIPDNILTKVLQFFIRHIQGTSNGSQESTGTSSPETSTACPVSTACAQCLNKALCCPFNDTFIVDSLRQFSFDEALVLLRYLHFLLSTMPASVQDDSTPTLNIVADWISALLDAHFTQLILSPEARVLLAELAQSVQMQESFYTELEAVKTILQSFKDSVLVPVKQTSGSYSIEVLTI